MKKIFLAILIMFSFCSLAISQNTTDSPTSTKKQAATKNSSQSKKTSRKTHHHKTASRIKQDSTSSGAGRSGAGIERSGEGLDHADSKAIKSDKPRVASENAGPGLPASGKVDKQKAGAKRDKSKKSVQGDADSSNNH
ncbi:MAG: hypothetical protein WKF97_11780 [Chitinophagaceae bacterium]